MTPPIKAIELLALITLAIFLAASPARSETPAAPEKAAQRSLKITADSVDMAMANGNAVFEGNVVLVDRNLRITADKLQLKTTQAGDLQAATFTGNVRITQDEDNREATAERAEYQLAEGELVLSGNPVLRDGKSVLRNAKRIVYNRDNDRFRTEGSADGERPTINIPLQL